MTITAIDLQTWTKVGSVANGAANKIDCSSADRQYVYNTAYNIPSAGSFELLITLESIGGWDSNSRLSRIANAGSTGFTFTDSGGTPLGVDWAGEPVGTADQTVTLYFTTTSGGNVELWLGPGSVSDNLNTMTVGASLDDAPSNWAISSVDDATPQSGDTIRISGTNMSASGKTVADDEGNAWTVTAQTSTYLDVTVPDLHSLTNKANDYGESIVLTVTDGSDSGTVSVTVSVKTGDFYGALTTATFPTGSLLEGDTGISVGDKLHARQTVGSGATVIVGDSTLRDIEANDQFEVAVFDESLTVWSSVVTKTFSSIDVTPDAFVMGTVADAEPSSLVFFSDVTVTGITSGATITPTLGGTGSNKEYSVNGGAFGTTATVTLNDVITPRMTSSVNHDDQSTYTLTLNGVSDTGVVFTSSGEFRVIVGGDTVDTNTVGTYTITYDSRDSSGNSATRKTRTVTVEGATVSSFEVGPIVYRTSDTQGRFEYTLNMADTVWYVVYSDKISFPGISQIKAGTDSTDSAALASGLNSAKTVSAQFALSTGEGLNISMYLNNAAEPIHMPFWFVQHAWWEKNINEAGLA